MKKRIIISLLCGIMVCCIAVYSFASTGIMKGDNVRLRKENSTDSSIITLLSVGDKVEILSETENGWYKVKYGEYEGYVSGQYVTVNDEVIIETETETESETTETPQESEEVNASEEADTEEIVAESTTKKIKKGERVYMLPLINTSTVRVLEKDLEVQVLSEINGWSYVYSEEFEGWVRTEILKELDAENKVGYINASSVSFREQPNTSSEVISKLTKNKEVIILEETNGWAQVEVNGKVGYVSKEYISSTKVATTSRSSSTRRKTTTTIKTETVDTTVVSGNANDVVEYAKQFLGYKYVYGGNTPSGFDCSGFTQYVYKHFGYSLSRSSKSQAGNGVAVSKANLQPGDIVCFARTSSSSTVGHVGIYIGGGKFIHAANARKGVIISNVDGDGFYYVCARRIMT